MSTAIAKNFQIGADGTASNNFTIFQPATPDGTLRIGNGNTGITSSLLALTSAGNLGIGTSSPSAKLHVNSGAVDEVTRLQGTGSPYISTYVGTTRVGYLMGQAAQYNLYSDGAIPLVLGTNSTERARIDTSGNFGIGTSSITNKLTVNGSIGASGSAGAFSVYRRDTNAYAAGWYSASGGLLLDMPGVGTALTVDASGNLGLGVTPSVWNSNFKTLEFAGNVSVGSFGTASPNLWIMANAYYNGAGNWIYSQSNYATQYNQTGGQHIWKTAPSGTAGAAITFTQAMTLNASGYLGINTTGPAYGLVVSNGGAEGLEIGPGSQYSAGKVLLQAYNRSGAAYVQLDSIASLFTWSISGNEKARIHSSGGVSIGNITDLGATNLYVTGSVVTAADFYEAQPTPTALTATGTLTIAQLQTNIITVTSTTAVTLTLPTGTLTDAGILGGLLPVNGSFDWFLINLGSTSGAVTMAGGTGHTYVGNATIAIGTSTPMRTRKTAANTFVTYRVG